MPLGVAEVLDTKRRNLLKPDEASGFDAPTACENAAVFVDEDGDNEAEAINRARQRADLLP